MKTPKIEQSFDEWKNSDNLWKIVKKKKLLKNWRVYVSG